LGGEEDVKWDYVKPTVVTASGAEIIFALFSHVESNEIGDQGRFFPKIEHHGTGKLNSSPLTK